MSAGRSIVPRYVAFVATGTASGSVTGVPNGTTIFAGLEAEGLTRQLDPIESLIEDNQTALDSLDLNLEGFVRGASLMSCTAVNDASVTSNLTRCKMFLIGAPGTMSIGVDNVIVTVHRSINGTKDRVRFKATKKAVRDVDVASSDFTTFTTP
jgi:hypothetical protein